MSFHSIKFTLPFFTFLFSVFLFAQKDFQGKAYYQTKTTVDMSRFGGGQLSEERKKEIAERMKNALEKVYVLTFNQTESIYKEEEKLETPGTGGGMRFGMMNASGGPQYKDVKNKLLLQEQDLYGKQFLIKDSLPNLKWDLGAETKMIGQYMCFKATAVRNVEGFDMANFGRRNNESEKSKDSVNAKIKDRNSEEPRQYIVTAWYTPQIPVSQGPDSYWGLPGLILEVSADRTTILCSKIVLNPEEKTELKKPSKGKEISREDYNSLQKEKTEEIREMYRGHGGGRSGRRN